jgi:predicted secreted protein
MTIVFGLAIFFVVWWIILFAVLPFGVHSQSEAGETVPGTPPGAPAKFAIKRVFLINTAVSFVIFCVIWAAIEFDWFGVGDLAREIQNGSMR